MHQNDIFAALVFITLASAVIAWIVFQAGRLNGYQNGVEEGLKRNAKMQHLRGMTDGYTMALRHTPGQRNEYVTNVLLKSAATSQSDTEAGRNS
ncbi:MAG TPA: hypothetical protein VIM12_03100 [Noviherbaspirillum sp.]|jgi:hypothetical protein|uniref:hypothetical protein n=1 Tax=Noviherbaspirillum sp. TaxID=1926288 RepID=UPI002F9381F2